MNILFLAFANSREHPLPTLREEDEQVYALLSRRMADLHFVVHRESYATLASVTQYLIRFREELTLFLYSGHADRDRLLLEDQPAGGEGIAELLGRCPRLKLVILNGCSTAGQAEKLLALPNRPAVIATSAPVGDRAATQFAISFFQAFAEQYATVETAYATGLAASGAAAQHGLYVLPSRAVLSREKLGRGIWLLDTPTGEEEKRRWKLPVAPGSSTSTDVQPNQFLLKGLLDSLAAYDPRAREVLENKRRAVQTRKTRRLFKGDNERRNVILKCLPFPISEHIKKLLSRRKDDRLVYYNTFSLDRLKQLLLTYDIALELPAFILLAQLYDLLAPEQEDRKEVQVTREQALCITAFLHSTDQHRLRDAYFPLLRATVKVLRQNEVTLFVPELGDFAPEAEADFYNACRGLERKKERLADLQTLDDAQIIQACIEAEEMLTRVLARLSFLAPYSLVSVRNIDVLRNRLFRTPSFVHRIVHLAKKDSESEPEQIDEPLDDFLDNESVLLMNKPASTDDDPKFLNLTPFIIDENAYIGKAKNIKLHFFHHYRESSEACYFKHTYKPDDQLLEIRYRETERPEELAILDVWEQYDVFRQLLQKAAL